MNKICTVIVVTLSSLILAFSFLEFMLQTMEKNQNLDGARYVRLKEEPPNAHLELVPDSKLIENSDSLTNKKYLFRTNSDGFIEPSNSHSDPDLKLVFLGGSTTECLYVDEGERFPNLTAKLLEGKYGLKINSVNAGVSGSHSVHSQIVLLSKIIPLKPDYIILMQNTNDLNILLLEKTYWNKNFSRSLVVDLLADRKNRPYLRFYDAFNKFFPYLSFRLKQIWNSMNITLKDEFKELRGKRIVYSKEEVLEDFSESLRSFVLICRAYHIKPILMTEASRYSNTADPLMQKFMSKVLSDYSLEARDYVNLHEAFNQKIREVATETQTPYIDLASEIPASKEWMYDPIHFNDAGSRKASEYIAARLAEILALKQAETH